MTMLTSLAVNVQPKQPAGVLLGFDVNVEYRSASPAAQLVGFAVEVKAKYPAAQLLNFDVHVGPKRTRWEAVVMLGGVDVSNRVTGTVSVSGQEGQNKIANFELKNPDGVIDPLAFINQPLTIDYIQPSGAVDRIFTGAVETPTCGIESGRTRIVASTLRDKALDKLSRDALNQLIGGVWSKYLFDEEAEGAAYAADLLRTKKANLQIDAAGVMRLVPWVAGVPDVVLTGDDVARAELSVAMQDAKSLVNKISVNIEYRYTRLRHRERTYHWDAPGHNYWGDYMVKPYPLVPKALIRSAIESTGWELKGDVQYQDVPGGGSYTVNGKSQGWLNPTPEKYAAAADWALANRFTQTITEKYSLSFNAPQSIEVWGEVPASLRSHGVTADYAADEWDDAQVYSNPPAGAVQSANGDWVIDATDTEEGSRASFADVQQIVLAMYERELLQAHRKNYVEIKLPKQVFANIDTHHTVQIASAEIACTGRVASVTHEFNRSSGVRQTKARIAISRAPATGSYSASPLVAPAQPNVADQALTPSTIKLGVKLGNAYGAGQLNEDWTGYISNYLYYDKVTTLEQYPTAFIVDTPVVEAVDRDERVAETVKAYDVLIPNDPLVINKS